MSRHSGPQGKGAARVLRAVKREEAEERNARTLPENRRLSRRSGAARLLVEIFSETES